MEKQCLYQITGKVIRGKSLGRQFGFPTANVRVADAAPLQNGVYVACADIGGNTYKAVVNVGRRPTVDTDGERLAEIHFLDFSGDLYDRELVVCLLAFIRSECRFDGLEHLKRQIQLDVDAAVRYFGDHHS